MVRMEKVKNYWLRRGSLAERLGFPSQYQLRLPLLELIAERGGAVRPSARVDGRDLYEALGRRVGLSPKAMLEPRPGAKGSAWKNHVAWTRYTLAKEGLLVSDPPGTWKLTALGRKSVRSGTISRPKVPKSQ